MVHLNAKYSFKNDIDTCYIFPVFIGSMLNDLIIYFIFRGKRTLSFGCSRPITTLFLHLAAELVFSPEIACHTAQCLLTTIKQEPCTLRLCPVPAHNAPVHFKSEGSAASFLSPPESFRVRGVLLRIQPEYLCFPHVVLFLKLIRLTSHVKSKYKDRRHALDQSLV